MTRLEITRVVTVAVGLCTLAPVAQARHYRHRARAGIIIVPRGLYVGFGLAGAGVLAQNGGSELLDNGAGFSLYSGLRLGPRIALELGMMSTFHNPAAVNTYYGHDLDFLVLDAFTGDVRIYLDHQSPRVEPFVQGGLGLYLLDSQYFGAQSVGTGFQIGGGTDLAIGPRADLTVRALYRGIAMGPPDSNVDDTFISALTIEGSVSLRF